MFENWIQKQHYETEVGHLPLLDIVANVMFTAKNLATASRMLISNFSASASSTTVQVVDYLAKKEDDYVKVEYEDILGLDEDILGLDEDTLSLDEDTLSLDGDTLSLDGDTLSLDEDTTDDDSTDDDSLNLFDITATKPTGSATSPLMGTAKGLATASRTLISNFAASAASIPVQVADTFGFNTITGAVVPKAQQITKDIVKAVTHSDFSIALWGWTKEFILPIQRNVSQAYAAWLTTGNLLAAFHLKKAALLPKAELMKLKAAFSSWLKENIDAKYQSFLEGNPGSNKALDAAALPDGILLFKKIIDVLSTLSSKDASQISFLDFFSSQNEQDIQVVRSSAALVKQVAQDGPAIHKKISEELSFIDPHIVHEIIHLLLNIISGQPVHNISEELKGIIYQQIDNLDLDAESSAKLKRTVDNLFDAVALNLHQSKSGNIGLAFTAGIEFLFTYDAIFKFLAATREAGVAKTHDSLAEFYEFVSSYTSTYQKAFGLNDKLLQKAFGFVKKLQEEIGKHKEKVLAQEEDKNKIPPAEAARKKPEETLEAAEAARKEELNAEARKASEAVRKKSEEAAKAAKTTPKAAEEILREAGGATKESAKQSIKDKETPTPHQVSVFGWMKEFLSPIINNPSKAYQAWVTAGKLMAGFHLNKSELLSKENVTQVLCEVVVFLANNLDSNYKINVYQNEKDKQYYCLIESDDKSKPFPFGLILLQKLLNVLTRFSTKENNDISFLDLFDGHEEDLMFFHLLFELTSKAKEDFDMGYEKYQMVKERLGLDALDFSVFVKISSLFLNIIHGKPIVEVANELKKELLEKLYHLPKQIDKEKILKFQDALEAVFSEEVINGEQPIMALLKLMFLYYVLSGDLKTLYDESINSIHDITSLALEKSQFYRNFFGLKEDFLKTPLELLKILQGETQPLLAKAPGVQAPAPAVVLATPAAPAQSKALMPTLVAKPSAIPAFYQPTDGEKKCIRILTQQINILRQRINPTWSPYLKFRKMISAERTPIWKSKLNALLLLKMAIENGSLKSDGNSFNLHQDISVAESTPTITWKVGEDLPIASELIKDAGFSQLTGRKSGTEKAIDTIKGILASDSNIQPQLVNSNSPHP